VLARGSDSLDERAHEVLALAERERVQARGQVGAGRTHVPGRDQLGGTLIAPDREGIPLDGQCVTPGIELGYLGCVRTGIEVAL